MTQPRARKQTAAPEPSGFRRVWEQVHTLVLAVLIALGVRAFVIEPFRIPSGSMLPTLLIGDHLFVNKFLYGAKIPFTEIRLPRIREPGRGDIVVFTVARQGNEIHPADRRPELPREEFVKRIAALPGDRIEVRNGLLRVNGEPVERLADGEVFRDEAGRELRVLEEVLGEHRHRILDDPVLSGLSRSAFRVEPGRYFVLGDNRDHSNDSRAWGTVRLAEIKGPAFVLYWSWDFQGSWLALLHPLTWWELLTERTRWERIARGIE